MQQALDAYYAALQQYSGLNVAHETALRTAMQNLLGDAGRGVGWTLVPEQTLSNGRRPDGTFRDSFNLARGYWEAKDTQDDLETEIRKKIAAGYPLNNMLFEDTRRAVLYQGRENRFEFDLTVRTELRGMVEQFTAYSAPDIEDFYKAVDEFAARLPELAQGLMERIETERQANRAFTKAFAQFHELCKSALNPTISAATIEEMLVQHLLTERLFRTIFENPDFTRRNVIAAEIEKVIDALTSRAFNRQEFLKSLDRYYVAIETKGRGITDWNEKQGFLNRVYERFFQGFSTRQADTHGVVYTPQEIVAFMCASVEHLLQAEFGASLSTPGVKILDPCTGTGNFLVNLIRHHISRRDLRQKVAEDLFANEIMLLPYYIASLNIEHEIFAQAGEYLPFEGLCFADTLDMAEGEQLAMFGEENTGRLQREKDAPITVILGNPPYNVGQQNENDNNKNRPYKVVDNRIAETYAKASKATNRKALSDAYVKFFRWATDRLQGRDGILAFVSNNSFLDQIAFDGMRKYLEDEFTTVYHLNCGGNVRKNPKLSGTTHNVFGIQVGVGITFLVRRRTCTEQDTAGMTPRLRQGAASSAPTQNPSDITDGPSQNSSPVGALLAAPNNVSNPVRLLYHALPSMARASERLAELKAWGSVANVAWQELTPDNKHTWLTEGLQADFESFLPIGTKDTKAAKQDSNAVFKTYSRGAETTRDNWMYDFHSAALERKALQMIETYNAEVSRWIRAGMPKDVDSFVLADETRIKWSSRLKECLVRRMQVTFDAASIRKALYRPFNNQFLYFDDVMTHRQGRFPSIFPTPASEDENVVICLSDVGSEKPFMVLGTNHLPDLHIVGAGSSAQCFPFYVYDEDGTNRRENITEWALEQFRQAHGQDVTKRDIFHYTYALLHDPLYRRRYAENLKRELPRIPLEPPRRQEGQEKQEDANPDSSPALSSGLGELGVLAVQEAFRRYVEIGAELMRLHLDYENAPEYKLQWLENRDAPFSWCVEKMRMSRDKTQIIVNPSLTLAGVPPECFDYRLGNRSALEWVLDQYQVTTDKRSGLASDPNRADDPEYIVRLVGRVITVSLETVKLIAQLRNS